MKHDRIFDELSTTIARPRRNWRGAVGAFAFDICGKLAAGLAIGIGIAVGMALAG